MKVHQALEFCFQNSEILNRVKQNTSLLLFLGFLGSFCIFSKNNKGVVALPAYFFMFNVIVHYQEHSDSPD